MLLHGVASDRVYIVKPMSPWAGCALTAPFHPYYARSRQAPLTIPPLTGGIAHLLAGMSFIPSNPLTLGFDGNPLKGTQRYLSVALVLGSPPAGVTRYPCLAKPGLSSRSGFHLPPAAVQPGGSYIVLHKMQLVKHLAKSLETGYTVLWRKKCIMRNESAQFVCLVSHILY